MHNDTRAPAPAYRERVVFDDGDHVTVAVEDPNFVEVRGMFDGEQFDVSLRSDVADDEAELLIAGNAPDPMWTLPDDRARRLGSALRGAATAARLAIPEADSPEDVDERPAPNVPAVGPFDYLSPGADAPFTVEAPLDGGVAYVDHFQDRVEVTVRLRGRLAGSLTLSPAEADSLGLALARPHGPTAGDLFTITDAMQGAADRLSTGRVHAHV